MAEVRLSTYSMSKSFFLLGLFICLISCSTMEIKREIQIPKEAREMTGAEVTPATPVKTPDFVPVHEDISPLKTRIVDISAQKHSSERCPLYHFRGDGA